MYVGPDGRPVDRDGNPIGGPEGTTLDAEGFIMAPNGTRYTPQGDILNVDDLPQGITVGADGVPRNSSTGAPIGARGTRAVGSSILDPSGNPRLLVGQPLSCVIFDLMKCVACCVCAHGMM